MPVDFDAAAEAAIMAFAEPCTYFPADGARVVFQGVFDIPFVEVDDLTRPAVATARPVVTLRLADLAPAQPAQGEFVIARGKRYVIKEPRPDGQGLVRLLLNGAADPAP